MTQQLETKTVAVNFFETPQEATLAVSKFFAIRNGTVNNGFCPSKFRRLFECADWREWERFFNVQNFFREHTCSHFPLSFEITGNLSVIDAPHKWCVHQNVIMGEVKCYFTKKEVSFNDFIEVACAINHCVYQIEKPQPCNSLEIFAQQNCSVTEKTLIGIIFKASSIATDLVKRARGNASEMEIMSHYQVSNKLAQQALQALKIKSSISLVIK